MSSLKGKIIAVTKSRKTVESAFKDLIELGAEIVSIPSINIVPIENNIPFENAVDNIGQFDYLVFTSASGVEFYKKMIDRRNIVPDYSSLKVACVGIRTADSCKELGIPVHIIPRFYSAAGLAGEMVNSDLTEKKILIPSSSIAREELSNLLKSAGAIVHSIPVYQTKMPGMDEIDEIRNTFEKKKIDLIVFTSPSNFSNFLVIFNVSNPALFFKNYSIGAIGHTTRNAIAGSQVTVDIVPEEFSLEGMAKSIINFYKI